MLSLSWQVLCSHVSEVFRFYLGSDNNFVVINQKDIYPPPLRIQARAGVTNSDLLLHDGSALTFNLELFGVPFYLRECVMMSPPELGT